MNIKSITTLGLVAVALAVTSIAPAEANNNKALNQMAMQMYMQNQGLAGNATIYNPALATNYRYNNAYAVSPWSAATVAPVYGTTTPWAAGALPFGAAASNYGYNNAAYGNIVAPKYSQLNQEAARINARLASGNLSGWEVTRLQNKLAKIQTEENSLAAAGYGSPYSPGVFNNLRSHLGIF
jgi:hypothetical protein